jgi:hypothetical protein
VIVTMRYFIREKRVPTDHSILEHFMGQSGFLIVLLRVVTVDTAALDLAALAQVRISEVAINSACCPSSS